MDATAGRLLQHQLLSEEHDKVPNDVVVADSPTATASLEGVQQQLTSLDSLLRSVYERQDQWSVAISAHIARLERQVGKLHRQGVKGAKTRCKVRRKRFSTSSAKNQKVLELLPPMPCIEQDDPAQRPAGSCAYFRMDAEDAECDEEPLEDVTPATSDVLVAVSLCGRGPRADEGVTRAQGTSEAAEDTVVLRALPHDPQPQGMSETCDADRLLEERAWRWLESETLRRQLQMPTFRSQDSAGRDSDPGIDASSEGSGTMPACASMSVEVPDLSDRLWLVLTLPSLLQHLALDDIIGWRQICRQTRSLGRPVVPFSLLLVRGSLIK